MCGSMVDIQSPTAEIRRGKKRKKETTGWKYIWQGGHKWSKRWWGGSGISWSICRSSALCSRQTTMPAPHHSILYRPNALPDAQQTVSKHWRQ